MREDARAWFERRGYDGRRFDAAELLRRKGRSRVSVVLPALDEEATVGEVVAALRGRASGTPAGGTAGGSTAGLVDRLVDEWVVVDSGSTDRTAEVAARAGARVVAARDVEPRLGHGPGKGEALWKSLFATSGDILVFVDADLVGVGPHYVTGLLGPLLTDPRVSLVKAYYDRPLTTAAGVVPGGGGRVTELVARPLLNLYWPALAGVVQPLSGEYAARRALLERLPFPRGYGVEIGLLVDALGAVGLDGLAQVDLGRREHSHQADRDLALMSASIVQTALRRLRLPARAGSLTQFDRVGDGHRPSTRTVETAERPPALGVPEYLRGRPGAGVHDSGLYLDIAGLTSS